MQSAKQVLSCLLLACLFLSGCAVHKEKPSAVQPDENCVTARAVVTYFLPKERTYLTNQEHLFCPKLKGLQIQAVEPQGIFTWKWAGQQYSHTAPAGQSADAYWDQARILAVYAGFLYGGGFLPADELSAVQPVFLEGQRYIPLIMPVAGEQIHVLLYRNQDTQKIDRILIEDKTQKKAWMANCYNWTFYSTKMVLIPRKMDIFDITDGVSTKKLVIQVDYKKVL